MNNAQKVNKLFSANAKETEMILKNKEIDVNIVNDYGKTSLFNAKKDKMEVLLKYGANIEHRDYKSNTPLLAAIDLERFIFLIESGADINAENTNGYSCLMKVSGMKDVNEHDAIKLLKERNFNFIGGENNTLLRLTKIKNINIWKEMFAQNCINEVPRYSFLLNGNEDNSFFSKKENWFLNNFTFNYDLVDYFFQKDEGLFSFILLKYNNSLTELKIDFSESLSSLFDLQMLKIKANEEKKLLLGNLNKPKDIVNSNKKRL